MSSSSAARFGLGARRAADAAGRERDVLERGEVREEVELLEHHADLAADGVEVPHAVAQLDPVHHDAPGVVLLEAVQRPQERGLPRAGGADDHGHLALEEARGDVAQHVGGAEVLVHALGHDERRRARRR